MNGSEKTATIKVIQAVYGRAGSVDKAREVTGIVQDLVNEGRTSFTANNDTLGGDPSKGPKHFAMTYTVGSSRFTFACAENQQVDLRTQEIQPEFMVIGAAYGQINSKNPGLASRDVTAIVQQLLDQGVREFKVDNALFGDPVPGGSSKNFGMTYVSTSNPNRHLSIASEEGDTVKVTF